LAVPIFSVPEFVAREDQVPGCESVDVDGGGRGEFSSKLTILLSFVSKMKKKRSDRIVDSDANWACGNSS
jgi:hypothetical protein